MRKPAIALFCVLMVVVGCTSSCGRLADGDAYGSSKEEEFRNRGILEEHRQAVRAMIGCTVEAGLTAFAWPSPDGSGYRIAVLADADDQISLGDACRERELRNQASVTALFSGADRIELQRELLSILKCFDPTVFRERYGSRLPSSVDALERLGDVGAVWINGALMDEAIGRASFADRECFEQQVVSWRMGTSGS